MDVIDTHAHIIAENEQQYPRSPLGGVQSGWAVKRPITAEQLLDEMDFVGISRAVLVQATTAYGYNNAYVLDSARRWPTRFVAVGTFDPLEPNSRQRLANAVDSGLSGVRLFTTGSTLTQQGQWFADDSMDEFWQAAADWGIPVCLQIRLAEAHQSFENVLNRFPTVKILLDHCGYPSIADSPEAAASELSPFAPHENLHLKLTHRNFEALRDVPAPPAEFLHPIMSEFGASRVMWGSNIPSANLSLHQLRLLAEDVLSCLDESDYAQVLSETAKTFYPDLKLE